MVVNKTAPIIKKVELTDIRVKKITKLSTMKVIVPKKSIDDGGVGGTKEGSKLLIIPTPVIAEI